MNLRTSLTTLTSLITLAGSGLALTGAAGPARGAEPAPVAPVVTSASTWSYLADDTDPAGGAADPRAWTTASYDDSGWARGRGAFGGKRGATGESGVYDSGHSATTRLPIRLAGADSGVRTYFLRTSFTLSAEQLAGIGRLEGVAHSDDGIVVHVNGTEVARTDVPAGTPTLGYADVSDTDLDTTQLRVSPSLLRAGANTVAVAVHQQRGSSSDIWFDLPELRALTVDEVTPMPSRVILTPTATPEVSQSVSWLGASASDTDGAVQIRPAAGGDVRTVAASPAGLSGGSSMPHFSATVTGLSRGTAYTYRVGSASGWSRWASFTTADGSRTSFDYLYYGDAQIGLDTTWPKVVAMARAQAPDAVGSVHAGDLVNTGGSDVEWANWFKGMETAAATTNVMAAPGNHEYSGDKLLQSWKAHFEYPRNQPARSTIGELARRAEGDTAVARQYAAYFDHWSAFAAETVYFTDYQGVRFITLNATRDTTFLAPDSVPACLSAECPSLKVAEVWTDYQAAWLDHVLASSPSKWNVVTFHQPVYSASSGRNEPVLRQRWVPVLQKHDVDLVQMGHDHVYARGFKDSDRTSTPGVTSGPVYVVSNAGAKHYDLAAADDNVWTQNGATQVKRGEDFSTYQVVSVSRDRLVYRSYLAEKTATSTTQLPVGALWDAFTITKTEAGAKTVVEGAPATVPVAARRPTSVRLDRVVLQRDRPGVVRVVASQAGRARVVLRRGGHTRRTTVRVEAGRPAAARFARLARRGARRVQVVVSFVPADGASYASSSTSRWVRIRR